MVNIFKNNKELNRLDYLEHDIPITTNSIQRHQYSLSTRLNRKYQDLFY
jgi:hypothetical protein